MSSCKHCVQGVRHEGKFETIGGIRTYVTLPTGDYPKDKAILYLSDIFGPELNNNLLLADDYARNGFQVYLPDLFGGDPVPADGLSPTSGFDITEWLGRHGPETSQPKVEAVIGALKEEGVTRFGAIGLCYGARLVFELAFEQKIDVAIATHPSAVEVEHLERYAAVAKAPLQLNTCETDLQFPAEKQAKADELFGDGKFKPGYNQTYFPGVVHGFAVRGDMSDPKVKAAKEGAFKASVEWFIRHL
ncbi:hypothetical protein EWM64_g7325 [Hericium alpestre]|uniref:Dienelactone hydrolase domain-containing protein n=1 Tax=Hericium alpestre TaxID=135208 RepID=A0A4Y9ZR29_9AGAM|nr:hypothetical protein EWM64_g7325 [Hericium alpestre]